MKLTLLAETFSVCRLSAAAPIPEWALGSRGLLSLTRTAQELSLVCETRLVPAGIKAETDWRALAVAGVLDFSLTGILASLANPLAKAGISLFAVSTFDTDFILVKAMNLEAAIKALRAADFEIASG
ncbi:MAG: ACT domain-containing protein [Bdellovibrionota bacterium]